MMQPYVIANPRAGSLTDARQLLAECRAAGCRTGNAPSHFNLEEQVRQALRSGARRLIVAGGDGSFHRVVDALAPRFDRVELAIVPRGTGNDLARSLGLPLSDIRSAVRLAVHAPAVRVDLIRIREGRHRYCVNAAAVGLGGRIAADVRPADKRQWGPFAYWMTAIADYADARPLEVQLDIDGEVQKHRTLGVVISNGRFIGGGFPIAEAAWLNDGRMDVTLVPAISPLELLSAGLQQMLGSDTTLLKSIPARSVRLSSERDLRFSIDGELTRQAEATFDVLPAALRLVAAPSALGIQRPVEDGGQIEGRAERAAARPEASNRE